MNWQFVAGVTVGGVWVQSTYTHPPSVVIERVPTAAEFPTASESGLPGFDAFTWFGLFAPSATPREIVVKLNAETVRGLNAPDTKEKMAAQGMFTTTAGVEEFGEFVKKETVRWGQIVKDAGVKPE